ncbi:recombinase family protein [Gemmiger formicilis]|nr:recombinase family protein [Gemmiger formicilis]MBM6916567.1 recombinase family protein [Gemmiger formicilis]
MDKLPPDAPRAGLAYRVSTKGQVDRNDDIPMQKIECRKFCVQHGWRITLEKAEKGVSGSKVSAIKRDAIQELKAEAEKGNIYLISHHKKCGPEDPARGMGSGACGPRLAHSDWLFQGFQYSAMHSRAICT